MENPINALDLERLQRLYERLDLDADGRVSANEINAFLQKLGMEAVPIHGMQDIVACFSSSNTCSLNFDEFVAFCKEFLNNTTESGSDYSEEEEAAILKDAFNVYDANGNGFISAEELHRVLESLGLWQHDDRYYYGVEDCQNMICRFDKNCDGLLDFCEFRSMMMMNTGAC